MSSRKNRHNQTLRKIAFRMHYLWFRRVCNNAHPNESATAVFPTKHVFKFQRNFFCNSCNFSQQPGTSQGVKFRRRKRSFHFIAEQLKVNASATYFCADMEQVFQHNDIGNNLHHVHSFEMREVYKTGWLQMPVILTQPNVQTVPNTSLKMRHPYHVPVHSPRSSSSLCNSDVSVSACMSTYSRVL